MLPPVVTTPDQTSLHSFMIAKKGSKSRIAGGGEVRRARLAAVGEDKNSGRQDRSRSPVPNSSDDETGGPAGSSPVSSGIEQGFGAAVPNQLVA